MSTPESELMATAYHEAGHLVAAYLYSREFGDVTLVGDDDAPGQCSVTEAFEDVLELIDDGWDTPSDLARVRNGLVTVLAGSSAEEHFLVEPPPSDSEYDHHMVHAMVERLPTSGSATEEEYLDAAWEAADQLWERPDVWSAVRGVAEALLQYGQLTSELAIAIIREVSPDLQPLDLPEERERWVWDDREGWVRHNDLGE